MTSPTDVEMHNIVSSSISDDEKIDFLEKNIDSLVNSNYEFDESYKTVFQLLTLDLIIGTEDRNRIEALLADLNKSDLIKNSLLTTDNYIQMYVKVRFNDLYGDYQFLVKGEGDKILELINKKTLLLNTIPSSYEKLRNMLNHKLLQLIIISRYDFRKANLASFVHENSNYDNIDPLSKELFTMVLSQKIIPLLKYDQFLQQIDRKSAIRKISNLTLHNNLLENNIYNLSNYYKSIRISRIYKILEWESNEAIEQTIFKMILSDRLPPNTKIDQEKDLLIFGNTLNEDYNPLNTHIKEISELLNNLNSNIIAGQ